MNKITGPRDPFSRKWHSETDFRLSSYVADRIIGAPVHGSGQGLTNGKRRDCINGNTGERANPSSILGSSREREGGEEGRCREKYGLVGHLETRDAFFFNLQ